MAKKNKNLFFCLMITCTNLFAQEGSVNKSNAILLLNGNSAAVTFRAPVVLLKNFLKSEKSISVVSPDYYSQHLGFFCKQEIKFDKISKIPFRFRLGTVEDCNRLEGKNKY